METQRRPLTFWIVVAIVIFAAMTALWAFGEEPTGAVLVLSTILWWGSGIGLIALGLIAIWRRQPAGRARERLSLQGDNRPTGAG